MEQLKAMELPADYLLLLVDYDDLKEAVPRQPGLNVCCPADYGLYQFQKPFNLKTYDFESYNKPYFHKVKERVINGLHKGFLKKFYRRHQFEDVMEQELRRDYIFSFEKRTLYLETVKTREKNLEQLDIIDCEGLF